MPPSHLALCPACARHVRAFETRCPFCGASLPPAFAARIAPRRPGVRQGRAALYAFTTASSLAVATAGCSSSSTPGGGGDAAPEVMPLYGAPVDATMQDSAAGGTDSPVGADGPQDALPEAVAAYGGPADSGSDGAG